ncbi:MAG: hypothetical protein JKX85_13810, partial [Phycisphaeraceae bacterium]|nr:hypothetical protein [Phycisphaeraceae bacterium]
TLMPGGIGGLWETASTFVQGWQFNSLVHGISQLLVGDPRAARWIAGGLLMFILLACMAKGASLWQTCCLYFFASLLCSSTVYPWYLLWALALFPLCFSRGLWILSLTIVISYEVLGHQDQWQVPSWIWAMTWLPVLAGVGWDIKSFLNRPQAKNQNRDGFNPIQAHR